VPVHGAASGSASVACSDAGQNRVNGVPDSGLVSIRTASQLLERTSFGGVRFAILVFALQLPPLLHFSAPIPDSRNARIERASTQKLAEPRPFAAQVTRVRGPYTNIVGT
jgi:hypothetical protein